MQAAAASEADEADETFAAQLASQAVERALAATQPSGAATDASADLAAGGAASAEDFELGAEVELHSLTGQQQLNGATGVVLGQLNGNGRLPVRLDPPHMKDLLLRPANLKRNAFDFFRMANLPTPLD